MNYGKNSPHAVGHRTLLMRTCPECGLTLPGSRFQMRHNPGTNSNARVRVCNSCLFKRKPEEAQQQRADSATEYRREHQRASIQGATKSGQPWTESELREVYESTETASVLAQRLRRTQYSIYCARNQIGTRKTDEEREQFFMTFKDRKGRTHRRPM